MWVSAAQNLVTRRPIAAIAHVTVARVVGLNDTTVSILGTTMVSRVARMNDAGTVIEIRSTHVICGHNICAAFDDSNASSVVRVCGGVEVESTGVSASPNARHTYIPVTKECRCTFARKRV
jgi:hypothetical protein